ncbi:MAG: hypothetical protein B7Z37_28070 [Verrucomicrobia bacterium 12-59-8]|nr:MAG: hypothetical protein B7Z37_28070 [Verrucomicrobia bacterium 12-59-8]
MSFETSKCTARRLAQGHLLKLAGNGIDIGAGDDPFRPLSGVCRPWDKKSGGGDASELKGLEAGSLDYVYASHCLEHLPDPVEALNRWADVIRSGGFMYVAVPDFDLYEGGGASATSSTRPLFHCTVRQIRRNRSTMWRRCFSEPCPQD